MKVKIAGIQKMLPNAKVGANFSPTGYFTDPRDGKQKCQNYLGFAFQWVRLFREKGLTLPWGEDWIWQTPIGTQQVRSHDVFHCCKYVRVGFDPSPTKCFDGWRHFQCLAVRSPSLIIAATQSSYVCFGSVALVLDDVPVNQRHAVRGVLGGRARHGVD
jgi:hypothetical protein